jgi:curved DNA-binding protein CbpA
VGAESDSEVPPETDEGSLISLDPGGPPVGPWEEITEDEWTRLTTNDKERVEKLAREMQEMDSAADWFAWFDLTHESPAAAMKKAYFKMARRYHPDALGDEPEVYSRVATSLFAKVSEAYEVLSDDEAREKYINKHILGLKDEDDLAMEKVQQVLAAEAAFKAGMTVLNNGKVTEALQHFKKAIDGYPDEAEYVAFYGYTLFRANQNSNSSRATEGLELIKKSIELKEMAPKPYHLLGKCYLLLGDSKTARQWLRKSLKLQPDNPEAVRDYRRAEAMSRGQVSTPASVSESEETSKGGLSGFFGRFRKEKKVADSPAKPNPTSLDDFDFSQFDD